MKAKLKTPPRVKTLNLGLFMIQGFKDFDRDEYPVVVDVRVKGPLESLDLNGRAVGHR